MASFTRAFFNNAGLFQESRCFTSAELKGHKKIIIFFDLGLAPAGRFGVFLTYNERMVSSGGGGTGVSGGSARDFEGLQSITHNSIGGFLK